MKFKRRTKKIPYISPKIKKLNPDLKTNLKKIQKGKAQGPPSMPGPAATSPSTPSATVF